MAPFWTYCSRPIVAYIIYAILWTPLLTLTVIMNTIGPQGINIPLCTSNTCCLSDTHSLHLQQLVYTCEGGLLSLVQLRLYGCATHNHHKGE